MPSLEQQILLHQSNLAAQHDVNAAVQRAPPAGEMRNHESRSAAALRQALGHKPSLSLDLEGLQSYQRSNMLSPIDNVLYPNALNGAMGMGTPQLDHSGTTSASSSRRQSGSTKDRPIASLPRPRSTSQRLPHPERMYANHSGAAAFAGTPPVFTPQELIAAANEFPGFAQAVAEIQGQAQAQAQSQQQQQQQQIQQQQQQAQAHANAQAHAQVQAQAQAQAQIQAHAHAQAQVQAQAQSQAQAQAHAQAQSQQQQSSTSHAQHAGHQQTLSLTNSPALGSFNEPNMPSSSQSAPATSLIPQQGDPSAMNMMQALQQSTSSSSNSAHSSAVHSVLPSPPIPTSLPLMQNSATALGIHSPAVSMPSTGQGFAAPHPQVPSMDASRAQQPMSAPARGPGDYDAAMMAHQQQMSSLSDAIQAQLMAQMQKASALPADAVIGQIGQLLDNVVTLANSARAHFQQGQHTVSSICLSDLQKALAEIGELGSRSLATVRAGPSPPSGERASPNIALPPHGSPEDSPTAIKKRPVLTSESDSIPSKTLRARDGTPVQPPLPPPSAPPFSAGESQMALRQQVPMAPTPPNPPLSAPPLMHATSAPQLSEMPMMQTQINGSASPSSAATSFRFPAQVSAAAAAAAPHAPKQPSNLGPGTAAKSASVTPTLEAHRALPIPIAQSAVKLEEISPALTFSQLQEVTAQQQQQQQQQQQMPVSVGETSKAALRDPYDDDWSDSGSANGGDGGADDDDDGWPYDDSGHLYPIANGNGHDGAPRPPSDPALAAESSLKLNLNPPPAEESVVITGGVAVGDDKEPSAAAQIGPELKVTLDAIFWEFLTGLCNNLDAKDHRNELIHQSLMPKKMARLEESPDWRPFRFRIQPFTNAFQNEVYSRGISEVDCGIKKIKQYLWTQKLIARFNEDGKKAKSRGNHIWLIDARKLPTGGWDFREFRRRIAGVPKQAYVNCQWSWRLRIWDPQIPSASIRAVFSAPVLPPWCRWENEDDRQVLLGTPTSKDDSTFLRVIAHYVFANHLHELEHSVNLEILDIPSGDGASTSAASDTAHAAPVDGDTLPSRADDVAPSEMDSKMADPQESVQEAVVAPSQVSNVLQAIAFPFTPPIQTDQSVSFYMGAEGSHPAPLPTQIPAVPQQMDPATSLQAVHLRSAIEERQQDQTRDLLLNIPNAPRRNAIAADASNQNAPTSAKPAMQTRNFNPMLSPALPISPAPSSNLMDAAPDARAS